MKAKRLFAPLVLAIPAAAGFGQTAEVPVYTAIYDAYYDGKRRGSSEFSVAALEAPGQWQFQSNTQLKGLLARIAVPDPVIERSRFELASGGLRPIEFEYRDGSRSGEDNFTLAFDWSAGTVAARGDFGQREFALEAGALDRGSLQVTLMTTLASCRAPGSFSLVDEDGIRVYEYEALGPAEVETGLGTLDTVRYRQSREGSSRSSILSFAPSLSYLPVRIEQIRDGEVRSAFVLDSVEGLDETVDPCRDGG